MHCLFYFGQPRQPAAFGQQCRFPGVPTLGERGPPLTLHAGNNRDTPSGSKRRHGQSVWDAHTGFLEHDSGTCACPNGLATRMPGRNSRHRAPWCDWGQRHQACRSVLKGPKWTAGRSQRPQGACPSVRIRRLSVSEVGSTNPRSDSPTNTGSGGCFVRVAWRA